MIIHETHVKFQEFISGLGTYIYVYSQILFKKIKKICSILWFPSLTNLPRVLVLPRSPASKPSSTTASSAMHLVTLWGSKFVLISSFLTEYHTRRLETPDWDQGQLMAGCQTSDVCYQSRAVASLLTNHLLLIHTRLSSPDSWWHNLMSTIFSHCILCSSLMLSVRTDHSYAPLSRPSPPMFGDNV